MCTPVYIKIDAQEQLLLSERGLQTIGYSEMRTIPRLHLGVAQKIRNKSLLPKTPLEPLLSQIGKNHRIPLSLQSL